MTITAFDGPIGTFPNTAGMNPETGPSFFNHGIGLLDSRGIFTYKPGQDFGAKTYIWVQASYMVYIDAVPGAISATNLATSQSPGAGAITLTAGTGTTGSTSIMNAATGATVTGLIAIDTAMTPITYGQAATMAAWDPTKAIARNIRLTSGGDDTGITFTVNGYDVYGFPMSETIIGGNAGVVSGAKAFKYISGVTHTGSVATTVTIGTGDVIGLPLQAQGVRYLSTWYGSPQAVVIPTFVAPVTTTATPTTGDVRGTIALPTASDGTKRLTVFGSLRPDQLASMNGTISLFSVTQA